MGVEQAREHWSAIAKENGWYKESFYVQVWLDADGGVSDSVSFKGMTEDIIIPGRTADGQCAHNELDDNDVCVECGEGVQTYTSCGECDWFGIPILDGGAPYKCNACLVSEHARLLQAVKEAETDDERVKAQECADECVDELDYFFDRQKCLDPSERRCKAMEEVAA